MGDITTIEQLTDEVVRLTHKYPEANVELHEYIDEAMVKFLGQYPPFQHAYDYAREKVCFFFD